MAVVRRISMQDAFKLAILLTLITLSSNMQDGESIPDEGRSAELSTTTASSPNLVPTTIAWMMKTTKTESRPNCPSNLNCSSLGGDCLNCAFNKSCIYGDEVKVTCTPLVECTGDGPIERSMVCQYCYQMDPANYTCKLKAKCSSVASPKEYYQSNCTVKSEFLCLGNRMFLKNLPCNWTGGYKWSTALLLSITLGGFGADRFYLGHWQEAIGKLFSFGGLGVWTLVDVVLIWLHYLGPADGSLYI